MPVVVAALEAMSDPPLPCMAPSRAGRLGTSWSSTAPQAAPRLQAARTSSPRWRANATVGRAIRSSFSIAWALSPGSRQVDAGPSRQVQLLHRGERGRESLGAASRGAWVRAGASTVTVFAPRGRTTSSATTARRRRRSLVTLGDTMASLGSFSPGSPSWSSHRSTCRSRAGRVDQARLKEDLYARARRTRADLKRGASWPAPSSRATRRSGCIGAGAR